MSKKSKHDKSSDDEIEELTTILSNKIEEEQKQKTTLKKCFLGKMWIKWRYFFIDNSPT